LPHQKKLASKADEEEEINLTKATVKQGRIGISDITNHSTKEHAKKKKQRTCTKGMQEKTLEKKTHKKDPA